MLKDYKARQEMFHHVTDIDDLIEDHEYIVRSPAHIPQVSDDVYDYFTKPLDVLVYPAKSYAVAIIYATLLEKYFGVPKMESLQDPDLLYGNDRYYLPYDNILTWLIYDGPIMEFKTFDESLPQVAATIEYFKKEFYLYSNPYFDNTDMP